MTRVLFFFLWYTLLLTPIACPLLGQTAHHHGRHRHPSSSSPSNSNHSTVFSNQSCNSDHFQLLCVLPYDGRPREIDSSCGHCGDALESGLSGAKLTAELAQNFQKDNLCAPAGSPAIITTQDLQKLQEHVNAIPNFDYGNSHAGGFGPPSDRAPLRNLAPVNNKNLQEGTVVRYAGFMVEEHYSPRSSSESGESVNCGASDHPNVDIHIALGDKPERLAKKADAAEKDRILCPTITAEMIPHFRPDDWEIEQLETISDRQVRVTGQLFFDGSHRACGDPRRANSDPRRVSSWEIHPVYAFEVCKSITGTCDINRDADWESLPDALAGQGDHEEP
jgi:hypothetical protein